jgi:small subunit ribosomal protein S18
MPRRKPVKDRRPKRKSCSFCSEKLTTLDYKDTLRLRKFITERGKIVPRRISGNCARHQRALTDAVKRARVIALLPFTAE